MLALDVEFLTGVCVAARGPSDPSPDWPPQPDRLFSALVASWAARGERTDERNALEWLEMQPAPFISAAAQNSRGARTCYVPPNDVSGRSLEAIPSYRRRFARIFPGTVPVDPVVSYCWPDATAENAVLEPLQRVARDTAYLGHSSSVVRCFFRPKGDINSHGPSVRARRRVYRGRLAELEDAFRRGTRPRLGLSMAHVPEPEAHAQASVFGTKWHVFADAGGLSPDLRATAIAARSLRGLILSAFGADPVPESISGHSPDGAPSRQPHMAVFPLADLGWTWSEGRLMGMAISLPRGISVEDETAFENALAFILRRKGSPKFNEIAVPLPAGGEWRVGREIESNRASLNPSRYIEKASVWATATPIVLDRHPRASEGRDWPEQVRELISGACQRIGLPAPLRVIPCADSAIRGSYSASTSSRLPEWTRWGTPHSLAGRPLTHATIVFDRPVSGPIVLGAGRFVGLGLCLPLRTGTRS